MLKLLRCQLIGGKRYNCDLKLVFGYFVFYAIGLLIPDEIMRMSLKFFHIIMRWDKYADDIKETCTEDIIQIPKIMAHYWTTSYSLGVNPAGYIYHEWKVKVSQKCRCINWNYYKK